MVTMSGSGRDLEKVGPTGCPTGNSGEADSDVLRTSPDVDSKLADSARPC